MKRKWFSALLLVVLFTVLLSEITISVSLADEMASGQAMAYIEQQSEDEQQSDSVQDETVTCAFSEQYDYGDVNLDGSVNVADALAILKHYIQLTNIDEEISLELADMNHDQMIDVTDALTALKTYVRLTDMEKYISVAGEWVVYSGCQKSYGELEARFDGKALGVIGKSAKLETVSVQKGENLSDIYGSIAYRVQMESSGISEWVSDGVSVGSDDGSDCIEAVQFCLTGALSEKYDIYYAVYVQKYGWTNWTKGLSAGDSADEDTGWCGTAGLSLQIESIKIILTEKDGASPTAAGSWSYLTKAQLGTVVYGGYQQSVGTLSQVTDGTVLGSDGASKRLEAIYVSLTGGTVSGSISYRVCGQTYGWTDWKSDGQLAGTTGQAQQMEAVEIKLSGEVAKYCNVWYRVYVEDYGWLGWAKNGQTAGTVEIDKRLEAIEIRLVPVAADAPGSNSGYYCDIGNLDAAENCSQLILVSVYDINYATVSMYLKENGSWKRYFVTTGRIGAYGLGKTKEGDMKTPTGVYSLHTPFGIQPDPGCPLNYVQVNNNHYWGGSGKYYNQFVDISKVSDFSAYNAEHIIDYGSVYNYCVAIGYNLECTEGKGSAIFLHCSGSGSTAGCVSVPESNMISVLQNLTSDAKIIIDEGKKVYNY